MLNIVVQNVATFRIDPHDLRRRDCQLAIVTSPANFDRMIARNYRDAFDRVVVTGDFSAGNLTDLVEQLCAETQTAMGQVRLLCHDEYSLGAVAAVRERLGVPGATAAQVTPFVNKLEMKRAVARTGVRLPRHEEWDHSSYLADPDGYVVGIGERIGWPAFVKPLDESGSVGTALLDGPDEAHAWARLHGGERPFEIDEFLKGTLYHVDTVLFAGEIIFVQANEYLYPCYDYLSGSVCSTFTLPQDDPMWGPLVAFNRRVIYGLGEGKPADTVFHHEIFRLDDGELVFLEIAARAPAALVPYSYERHRGFNIELAHFQVQMGERPPLHQPLGPYAGWVYFPRREGVITELRPPQLASPHELTWLVEAGQRLDDPKDIREAAATVLLWNNDFAALRADLARLADHQAFAVAC